MENAYLGAENVIHNMQPIIRGTNKTLVMNLYTSSRQDELFADLLGASIVFGLKKNSNSRSYLFDKLSSSPTDISIISASQLKVYIEPADTTNLTPSSYFGELIVTTTNSEVYKVLMNIPIV